MYCESSFSLFSKGLENKDLLGLKDLKKEEIDLILERAFYFKNLWKTGRKFPFALDGRTIANLFFEPSTRTRISFEQAILNLGGRVINFDCNSSSVQKGETLLGVLRTVESLGVQGVVLRHCSAGTPALVAGKVMIPVINAGDGCHEHPTQALLDLFTIKEKKGSLAGLKVIIIGDILHSRVARSNIWGLLKMEAEVTVVGPFTLLPQGLAKMGVKVSKSLPEALAEADVVYVLRLQRERQKRGFLPSIREYKKFYGITGERVMDMLPETVIMHPGPVVPGVEIEDSAVQSSRSLIQDQARNGVFVRMAVMEMLLAGEVN